MARLRWRPFPCPDYDLEGTESWLEAMAGRGLFLRGCCFGFAGFAQGTPRAVRYRLNATRGSVLDGDWRAPDGEERALSAAAGWYYVCPRGRFFVYACDDPQAPELHTDPAVQALQLGRIRRDAWAAVGSGLFFAVVHPLLWFHDALFCLLAALPLYMLGLALTAALGLAAALCRAFYLRGLARRLRCGQAPVRDARQRRRGLWLQGLQAAELAVLVLFTAALFARWGVPAPQPLAAYTAPLPFATLADVAGGGEVEWAAESKYTRNEVTVSHTLTAPAVYDFVQDATVRRDGAAVLAGTLFVDYYETRWDWLARGVARDLKARWLRGENAARLLLPGIDEAWLTPGSYRQLLLRRGCRVMSVTYLTTGEQGPTMDDALPVFVKRFLAG